MKVGFIGLGRMGQGMAGRLLEAGHEVVVFNRTPEKARPLQARGAAVAEKIADACRGEVVVTMLSDDRAVEESALGPEGILAGLPSGATHVSSSTVSPALVGRLAEAHARAGQGFVAAPVLGRPDVAAAGKLTVIAAGPPATLARIRPVLDAIGQRTFVVSDRPPAAAAVKLSANFLLASAIESMGEAFALAEAAGVDRHQYLELLLSTSFGAPAYRTYGELIVDRKFEPASFPVRLGEKDLALAVAAAEEEGVPMPLAELLHVRFRSLIERGNGSLDWAALGSPSLAGSNGGKRGRG